MCSSRWRRPSVLHRNHFWTLRRAAERLLQQRQLLPKQGLRLRRLHQRRLRPVQLYRKADTKTKKAAINLLEGDSNAIELIGALLSAKGSGSSGSSGSSGTSDLLNALLSGKTGGSSSGAAGKDTINALMEMLGKAGK